MAIPKLTLIERLERLQKQERKAKDDIVKLEGALTELMSQLENQFGLTTLKQAQEKLLKLEESLATREARADRKLIELERYL